MKVTIGNDGIKNTYQEDFRTTIHCECGHEAHLAFVAIEDTEDAWVSSLHKNRQDGFWPHDAIAVAVYLCQGCFVTQSKVNQA